jgi:hypothetical protein
MAYTTIDKPTNHFNTKTYTGTGSNQSISSVGFQPDFVWIKDRTSANNNNLNDSVRGANKQLYSDLQNAETTATTHLTSFDSDGFTLGNDGAVNTNTNKYVSWNWLGAGTSPSQTYTVKVVSDSGNKYRFDDFGTSAVTLDLQEGGTYTFDQSDSSNSGHPLRFSTTSDGSHGGGSEYTTGVTTTGTPGSSGAKTVITVASSAPTLYYYCTQHSGMGGQANTNSTHGSSNFGGTIQSNVSANTTAGFSIVSYTGTTGGASSTIGHGLGVTPDLVILKPRSYVGAWWWAQKGRSDKVLELQATNTEVDPSSSFGGGGLKYSTFTSSVFGGTNGTSNDDLWNTNGATYIAYCFAEKKGFSKLFKYQGNGNTNGTMVHLGFKPAFIICRDPGNLENWFIFDNKRDGINVNKVLLYANDSSGDTTSGANQIDLLSNGFKTRATNNGMNRNGATFIGFAFAENPFVTSGGIPCTAR